MKFPGGGRFDRPSFWTELFERRRGSDSPKANRGTNPNDMAHDPQLYEVGRWF